MKHTTTYFYVPPTDIRKGVVSFSEDESGHLARVLRAKEGDEVVVVDGNGGAYRVAITRTHPEYSRGEIIGEAAVAPEPNIVFTLGLGAIKPKRMESAWDSCVQLGISRLVPLHTDYSLEKLKPDGKYMQRLHSVSLRAMKQSRRAMLPEVLPPMSVHGILGAGEYEYIFFADPEGLPDPPSKRPRLGESILLLVGPEGGFSAEERRHIANSGGIAISLGPRRLRAETASAAISVIALRWTGDI